MVWCPTGLQQEVVSGKVAELHLTCS